MNGVAVAVNEAAVNEQGGNIMKLIDEKQAAEILGCTVSAMRKWRTLGKGPAYRKIGRLVRYSLSELEAYMESCRVEGNNNG